MRIKIVKNTSPTLLITAKPKPKLSKPNLVFVVLNFWRFLQFAFFFKGGQGGLKLRSRSRKSAFKKSLIPR